MYLSRYYLIVFIANKHVHGHITNNNVTYTSIKLISAFTIFIESVENKYQILSATIF